MLTIEVYRAGEIPPGMGDLFLLQSGKQGKYQPAPFSNNPTKTIVLEQGETTPSWPQLYELIRISARTGWNIEFMFDFF